MPKRNADQTPTNRPGAGKGTWRRVRDADPERYANASAMEAALPGQPPKDDRWAVVRYKGDARRRFVVRTWETAHDEADMIDFMEEYPTERDATREADNHNCLGHSRTIVNPGAAG